MNAVLTKEQALEITKGRTPLVPVEYETAVKSLQECLTLDEAKYWDNKADILAAWAKIYHNNEAVRKAKMLRLHAYRRMGQLAAEIRPRKGFQPGPFSLLVDSGLTSSQAHDARTLANMNKNFFNRALKYPKAPSTVANDYHTRNLEPAYKEFVNQACSLRSVMAKYTPAEIIKVTDTSKIEILRRLAIDISEWLDELEHKLPKN